MRISDWSSDVCSSDLLEVEGEKHLWSSRPCVFIFNHQSKADVMILAKLIRRDMGAVGKKEIRDIPILGKLMEWGGTVFVDRADGQSAIRAMEPLVDAIRKERSEERRVGKECVSKCRARWGP